MSNHLALFPAASILEKSVIHGSGKELSIFKIF